MTVELLYSWLRPVANSSHIRHLNIIVQLSSYLAIKQYYQRSRT
jgi:hypothetical protein